MSYAEALKKIHCFGSFRRRSREDCRGGHRVCSPISHHIVSDGDPGDEFFAILRALPRFSRRTVKASSRKLLCWVRAPISERWRSSSMSTAYGNGRDSGGLYVLGFKQHDLTSVLDKDHELAIVSTVRWRQARATIDGHNSRRRILQGSRLEARLMAQNFIFTMHDLRKVVNGKEILRAYPVILSRRQDRCHWAERCRQIDPDSNHGRVETEFVGEARPDPSVRIGYLPQEPLLDPALDVLGNVELASSPCAIS